MIDNSDKVGHWSVIVTGEHNQVRAFQCPTMTDVRNEVKWIALDRTAKGLVTKAFARKIIGRTRGGLTFDKSVNIL